MGINYEEMFGFYSQHIKEVLLPFWIKNGIDYEYGGYFTCFSNNGEKLLSHDKYTWSQGRMVWVFSKLSTMDALFTEDERANFLSLAKIGNDFLIKNCILPSGNCTFIMERNGKPKKPENEDVYDTSFYADCFAVLGVSFYGALTKDKECLEFCRALYLSIIKRADNDNLRTAPYPVPKGYKMHGIPMILLNTSHEYSRFLKLMGDRDFVEVNKRTGWYLGEILNDFVDDDFVLHEMVPLNQKHNRQALCERYINPGHIIEDMWFIIHYARENKMTEVIDRALKIAKGAVCLGWDKEYGGLLLFADEDGGKPTGDISGMENEPMVQKVCNDWDSKLWWPHSELLYTLLLCNCYSEDDFFAEWYQRAHDYTFSTFPNPNKDVGEWVQIRDRYGNPEEKTVALSVKDPFHILRNFLLIIDLLKDKL